MNRRILERIIQEEVDKILLESVEVCIAPPFMVDDSGKILDPIDNPQAYGLPGEDWVLIGGSRNKPKYYGVYDSPDAADAAWKKIRSARSRKGGAKGASDLNAQKAAEEAAKNAKMAQKPGILIPGTSVRTAGTVTGEVSGILNTGRHQMVRVMVDGQPQTFIKGSGRSQIYIKKSPSGDIIGFEPMPIQWYPLGKSAAEDLPGTGKFTKIRHTDPKGRFVKDGKPQQHPTHGPETSVQLSSKFRRKMEDKYGSNWHREVTPDSDASKDLLMALEMKDGGVTYSPPGKWPHPNSEYGKISRQLGNLESKGQLEKVFGKMSDGGYGQNTRAVAAFMDGKDTAAQAAKNINN